MLRHPAHLLIALYALLFCAIVVRVVVGSPGASRNRTRLLRWRIRLYLRPSPGYASLLELAIRWSRLRAVHTGRRARPSLPWWARLVLPVTVYAVRLGRAQYGRRVIASMEDQTLVLAAPRTGKSGWLADRIIDHPGAVVTTTTRTDLLQNTAALRSRHGTVHVFNPEGTGGVPSTFRWNPLQDCQHPAIALQRATALTAATESQGMLDMAYWMGKASAALASLLHAAALTGQTMSTVYQWAHGAGADSEAERILATHPRAAKACLGPIREIRKPGRTADSVRMTMTRALAWLADPAVAAATSPGPGEGFDVADFVSGPNTLYMIGTGREEAPIAPLFRAFAEYVHAGAALAGSLQPHSRLDPPLLVALDEVTQICPVPLPMWMADSAGKGILIVAVCHGLAQLETRWTASGARAIWDTAAIKVILGGVSDSDTLDHLSRLCGEIEIRRHNRSQYEDGRRAYTTIYQQMRVLPPELLRTLPDRRALIIRANLSPVIVRLRMAWRRHDNRRARRLNPAVAQSLQIPEGTPDRVLPRSDDADDQFWPPVGPPAQPMPGRPGPQLTGPGNLTHPRLDPRPITRPASTPPTDLPPRPPTEPRIPRPRRPWEPPTDPGSRK